jgi:hypothetical protein
MKKAKFMLAAIAVLAIAGGVYASKAKREGQVIYTRSNPLVNVCDVPVEFRSLTGVTPLSTTYATLIENGTCTTHPIYTGL